MTHISSRLSPGADDGSAAFRQLRHQTKNALQRILCQISTSRDLQSTAGGRRLVDDLERRVRLSATVSDALFGLTAAPGPLPRRLEHLCQATIDLLGDPDQMVKLVTHVAPGIDPALDEPILRIAHELVGNAVKHGLYARSIGTVTVRVTQEPRGSVLLQVLDDGWGFKVPPARGEGLLVAAALANLEGGEVCLDRRNGATVATATLRG